MKKTLLMVRVPQPIASALARNKRVFEEFDTIAVVVAKTLPPKGDFLKDVILQENANPKNEDVIRKFLGKIVVERGITHGVICQPLLWYSTVAAEVLRGLGIKFVWTEAMYQGRMVFDSVGCQYTRDNEIVRYWDKTKWEEPTIFYGTRYGQPPIRTPKELYETYGVGPEKGMVLFGQVEHDMSLVDCDGRVPYVEWVKEIVRENPDLNFLIKEHPLHAQARNYVSIFERIGPAPNVKRFDESVQAAFQAYKMFAAYSSTVILEGGFRMIPFVTGGYHFLDHEEMCVRVTKPEEAKGLRERVLAFRLNEEKLHRRLGFITRHYTMGAGDSRLRDKIVESPDVFYRVRK